MIAYKQPVEQSMIIKLRGNSAYDHIKQLKDQSFVTSEKSGRTRVLKLSKTFYSYFDVNKEEIQSKFNELTIKLEDIKEENAK